MYKINYLMIIGFILLHTYTIAGELPNFHNAKVEHTEYYETGEKKREYCTDNLIKEYNKNGTIDRCIILKAGGRSTYYIYNPNGNIEKIEEHQYYQLKRIKYYDNKGELIRTETFTTRTEYILYLLEFLLIITIGYYIFQRIRKRKIA